MSKDRQDISEIDNGRQEVLKKVKEYDYAKSQSNLISLGEEIQEALKTSKRTAKRLGQGINKGMFYHGTTLIYKGKSYSAAITKDKTNTAKAYLGFYKVTWKCQTCGYSELKIETDIEKARKPQNCRCESHTKRNFKITNVTNPIKDQFGLNYRTEFNDDSIDYIWKTQSINNYLLGTYTKKKVRGLYEDIEKINKKYIDHLNPAAHKYIACWIIGTYVFTLFEQFGRLYFRAERGSGKTKQCRIIKFLAFNSMWVTKGTESSLFRDAEATCGTVIIDNMDKLHEDLKKAIEHSIETGWQYDSTIRLTNQNEGKTQKFQNFSGMSLNNIYGLDENTIDKTFEVPMLKSINSDIKRIKPTTKSENWEILRDNLRYWALDNWEKVKETYESLETELSGREYDVAEVPLTIAKLIGEDVYKDVLELVKERMQENESVDLENNHSFMVFSHVWKYFLNNPLQIENNFFFSDISEDGIFEKFNPNLEQGSKEYTNKKRGFARYLGKIIKGVPMFRKTGLSNGRTYVKIKKRDLQQYMKLQHFINDDLSLLTSTTSTTSTISTTSTSKVEQVEQVETVEEKYDVDKVDKNFHKCYKCDTTPCEDFDMSGRPICGGCSTKVEEETIENGGKQK